MITKYTYIRKIMFMFSFFISAFSLFAQEPFWVKMDVQGSSFNLITSDYNGRVYASTLGGNNSLWITTNEGETWTNSVVSDTLVNAVFTSLVHIPNYNYLCLATSKGFFFSSDYGISWMNKKSGIIPDYINCLIQLDSITLLGGFQDGVYKTTNFGDTWTKQSVGNDTLYDVDYLIKNSKNQLLCYSFSSGIYRSTDSGVNWTNITAAYPYCNYIESMAINDSDYIYAGIKYGGVHRSTNDGASWEYVGPSVSFLSPASISCGLDGLVVISTFAHYVYMSCDYGLTWNQVIDGLNSNLMGAVHVAKNGFVYVGTWTISGGLFRSINRLTSIPQDDKQLHLKDFYLSQNYPNPFNPTTVISYKLGVNSKVSLKLYDVLGRKVATLIDEQKEAGSYNYELHMSSYGLSSGIYLYEMTAGEFRSVKKMVLMK